MSLEDAFRKQQAAEARRLRLEQERRAAEQARYRTEQYELTRLGEEALALVQEKGLRPTRQKGLLGRKRPSEWHFYNLGVNNNGVLLCRYFDRGILGARGRLWFAPAHVCPPGKCLEHPEGMDFLFELMPRQNELGMRLARNYDGSFNSVRETLAAEIIKAT